MNITLHDVAKYAKVSTATVSRALNSPEKVSEEVKKRIEEAIKTTGYKPNQSARALKTGIASMIGFVVPDITNPMYGSVILKLEQRLLEKNLYLLLIHTDENIRQEQKQLDALKGYNLGALILASTCENFNQIKLCIPQVPTMLFDRQLESAPFSCARISSRKAYYSATAKMLGDGHRKIGLIMGLERLSTTIERKDAFIDAFNSFGLKAPERLMLSSNVTYDHTSTIVDQLLSEGCTSIICGNRKLTTYVVCYLCSKGIMIGKDIEISGTTDSNYSIPFENSINKIIKPIDEISDSLASAIIDCVINRKDSFKTDIIHHAIYNVKQN